MRVILARRIINEFVSEKAMGNDGYLFPADLCRCQMMTLRNRSLREMLSLLENLQLPPRIVSLTAGWFSLSRHFNIGKCVNGNLAQSLNGELAS